MWRILLIFLPLPALADAVVATRAIHPQMVITAEDVTLVAAEIPGALNDMAEAIGQEASVAIYPGRPVLAASLRRPALVERNQIVRLVYQTGALAIATEGRALGRGGAGEMIEVMNLSSHNKVTGLIGADGAVLVGQVPGEVR